MSNYKLYRIVNIVPVLISMVDAIYLTLVLVIVCYLSLFTIFCVQITLVIEEASREDPGPEDGRHEGDWLGQQEQSQGS